MAYQQVRPGFSLIEALVVLAIGGMALAIIFTIGTKAGDTGFGLGRRAMTAADADIGASDLRSILRSIALRPPQTFLPGTDSPVSGDASQLEADVVMERATQCAPQGWAGRIVLKVETTALDAALTCQAAGRTPVLMKLGRQQGTFSYSADGQTWGGAYTNLPQGPARDEPLSAEAVWIRFSAGPAGDVIERAKSGRPEAWLRPDVQF